MFLDPAGEDASIGAGNGVAGAGSLLWFTSFENVAEKTSLVGRKLCTPFDPYRYLLFVLPAAIGLSIFTFHVHDRPFFLPSRIGRRRRVRLWHRQSRQSFEVTAIAQKRTTAKETIHNSIVDSGRWTTKI